MSLAMLKKLGAVAFVLLVAWIIYIYRQVPHEQAPFAKTADRAVHVVLEQGLKKVELRKDGAAWSVSLGTGVSYAVDEERVGTLISGLKDLKIEDEISDRADRAADYEVNPESGTRVRLFGDKESPLAEGIFGKQAPDFNHIYFRYSDKPNVYLARDLIRGELGTADLNSWRSRQLVTIPETQIQGILIEGNGFKSDLVRVSTDNWNLNGKAVEPGLVNGLVGVLAHLRADDFVDPAAFPQLTYDGLTYSRIIIKGAGSSAELRFGPPDDKTKRYPASAGKDAGLVWLSESSATSILRKPSAFPAASTSPEKPR
jgi:hypothetical protein